MSRLPAPVSPFVSPHSSPSIGGLRRCLPSLASWILFGVSISLGLCLLFVSAFVSLHGCVVFCFVSICVSLLPFGSQVWWQFLPLSAFVLLSLPLSPFASRHLCLPFVVHFSPFFRICLPVGYKCRSSICNPFVPSYRPSVPLAFDCNSVLACLLIVAWLWRGLAWVGMGGVWLLCICRRVCLSLYCNLLRRILALIPLFPHLSSCVSCFCLSLYSPLDVFVTHCIWVLPWCHFPHCLLGCEHSFGVCVAFRWPPVSHATAWYRLAKHGKHSSAPLKSTLAKQLAEARNEI